MTDNWKQNKSWIYWTIWRREQYESEEHFSNLKFFLSSSIIWNIKSCAVVDFMHDGNQRLTDKFPLPDTMHPNYQSETRQTPFLPGKPEKCWTELWKRTGCNGTYSRYSILKTSSSCNSEIFFSSNTEPIQVKLDIFLLWKNISFNHLLIDDCISFVLACVSFHWLADKYKVNSNLSAKKYSKGYT